MSLTSYRAAPSRVGSDSLVLVLVVGKFGLFIGVLLEDLAATYSPAP